MINEDCNYVEAVTIEDGWRQSMWLCVKKGKDFMVKGGSYVGQIRKQLPYIMIRITNPGQRPLAPSLPPGVPVPTSEDKIESIYFPEYIMGYGKYSYYGKTVWQMMRVWWYRFNAKRRGENFEQYTYGDFICEQLPRSIDLLVASAGNTNQACIAIGDIGTTFLNDPPCLRTVSFKVVDGRLQVTVWFRSWDLYAGLPENLGGIQLLKEYVLCELQAAGLDIVDGDLIAMSDGLHLYDQYFEIVDTLNIDKVQVGTQALMDKQAYIEEHGG